MNQKPKTTQPKAPAKGAHGGARASAGRPKKQGVKTGFYLSTDAMQMCEDTAKKLGVAKTAVIELAIREFAAKNGVSPS